MGRNFAKKWPTCDLALRVFGVHNSFGLIMMINMALINLEIHMVGVVGKLGIANNYLNDNKDWDDIGFLDHIV